jgi:hypothetical protein
VQVAHRGVRSKIASACRRLGQLCVAHKRLGSLALLLLAIRPTADGAEEVAPLVAYPPDMHDLFDEEDSSELPNTTLSALMEAYGSTARLIQVIKAEMLKYCARAATRGSDGERVNKLVRT